MRYLSAVLALSVTVGLCWFLDHSRTAAVPFGPGRVLDPFNGMWQNMEGEGFDLSENMDLPGLQAPVKVHYDARKVPHIFAENDHDLYYMQGYVTARDRLWQMEFQIFSASGRISELIDNPRAVEIDRMRRRTGMVKAAEAALELISDDPEMLHTMDAYTEGVNTWINGLGYADLPMEYKLLDYAPENWSNLKSILLLKLMAWDLTGRSMDFANTNVLMSLDSTKFAELFPYSPDSVRPIVPRGDSFLSPSVSVFTPNYSPKAIAPLLDYPQPHPNNGSNNWAVSGTKTASGYPILCNDPHLSMRLPAIWYEVQLTTPKHSVYGVSLPGSPCVIIGFNENVAWGVTNASRDVQDWYDIEFKGPDRKEYKFDGAWKPATMRIETVKRKGKSPVVDTVRYTVHGPVVFDNTFQNADNSAPLNVAMRWRGLDPSNELRTFYMLNRAETYADYRAAIKGYACPGQNIIFANRAGDIGITQQGDFPAKWPGQGQFIMDGANPDHVWKAMIPSEENPTSKNPARGFLFSANQNPTDASYPYRMDGLYDMTRNRRIPDLLSKMEKITAVDMQRMQNDNFNQEASEVLPQLLSMVRMDQLSADAKKAYFALQKWSFMNDPQLYEPAWYEAWADSLRILVWEDDLSGIGRPTRYPARYLTLHWLVDTADFAYADDLRTTHKETKSEIVTQALEGAVAYLRAWSAEEKVDATWQNFNNVRVIHLALLKPFSHYRIPAGGNHGIVNASFGNHGPSWRMVVELGPTPKAWGVFPGGQSGNPGSPNFDHMIDEWSSGKYFPLVYLTSAEQPGDAVSFSQTFQPK